VGGRRLSLSNLEKELYPAGGFTKAHILDYYRRAADVILPHLSGRALTLKRYPEGVDQDSFFEKRCPEHRPPWVKTAEVARRDADEAMTVCLVDDLATLMWVQNLASLELHVPLARAASPETPDSVVFDLDPGEGAGIPECTRVALVLRELLARLRLTGFAKTSGKKGLHVFVPLNRAEATFDETKAFSRAVAETLQKDHPDLVTAKMAKELRAGKVFINWSQNSASKTMVCVYSLRAEKQPTVSFPLAWPEVEALHRRGAAGTVRITAAEALRRIEKSGDLFREVLRKKQQLPSVERTQARSRRP
jgi:bifunctional non-homologous end joining protein LigD